MRSQATNQREHEQSLDEAIAAYLLAAEGDPAPDRQQWLLRYPHLAHDLKKFFADQDGVERVAGELRQAVQDDQAHEVGQHARQKHAADATHLAGGTVLGDFRVIREVGRGGMGLVYEAEQISLGRRVALKVLPYMGIMDPRRLQRFRHEAQAAAQLHHTNIVPVFFVGGERGVHYYAMQFIDGRNLSDVIRELQFAEASQTAGGIAAGVDPTMIVPGRAQSVREKDDPDRFSGPASTSAVARTNTLASRSGSTTLRAQHQRFQSAAQMAVQVAEALDYAHQQGIIHRDVKPANLMLDATGHLWVTDFGLARIQADSGMTMTGDLMGTLRYMSPEQAMAKRIVVDHRTDIYSLGATLYELLTLQPSLRGDDRQDLLRQIAFEDPIPLRRVNRLIPVELETIVLKAMAKNPAERYGTAQELADDLRRYLDHRPILAKPPTFLERLRKWARRHQPLMISLGISAALLLIGFIVGVVGYGLAQRQLARDQSDLAQEKEQARLKTAEQLYRSLFNQAVTLRKARSPGYRREVWKNLHEAIELDVPGKDTTQIHDEVMACLADPIGLEPVSHPAVRRLIPPPIPDTFQKQGPPYSIRAAAPDGKLLAYVPPLSFFDDAEGLGKELVLMDSEGTRVKGVDARVATIRDLAFSQDGKFLIAGGEHGIAIYEVSSLGVVGIFRVNYVRSVAINPDNQMVASLRNGHIELWSLNSSGSVSFPIGPELSHARKVEFSADGKMLLAISDKDEPLKGWWIRSTPEYQHVFTQTGGIPGVAFNPDGTILASVGKDHLVRLWDPATGDLLRVCSGHEYPVQALEFSGDGRWLATADNGGVVRLWNPDTGVLLAQISTAMKEGNQWWRVRFDPSSRYLVAVGDGGVEGWALRDSPGGTTLEPFLNLLLPATRDLAIHPGGTELVLKQRFSETGRNGQILAFDLKAAQLRLVDPGLNPGRNSGHVLQFHFDDSGKALMHQGERGSVVIDWSGSARDTIWPPFLNDAGIGAITLDARWGAGGGANGNGVYDLMTCTRVVRLPEQSREAWTSNFSPAGTQLALGFSDGRLEIWNLEQVRARLAEFGIAVPSTQVLDPPPRTIPQPSPEEFEQMVVRNRRDGSEAVAEFYRSIQPDVGDAEALNSFAWHLATVFTAAIRDPDRAVELAKKAVAIAPREGMYWNTLGAAHYRAGHWQEAIASLEKSMELQSGGIAYDSAYDWYFLAMAHWQLGNKSEAVAFYDRGMLAGNPRQDKDLRRLQEEAAQLLEIPTRPTQEAASTQP